MVESQERKQRDKNPMVTNSAIRGVNSDSQGASQQSIDLLTHYTYPKMSRKL